MERASQRMEDNSFSKCHPSRGVWGTGSWLTGCCLGRWFGQISPTSTCPECHQWDNDVPCPQPDLRGCGDVHMCSPSPRTFPWKLLRSVTDAKGICKPLATCRKSSDMGTWEPQEHVCRKMKAHKFCQDSGFFFEVKTSGGKEGEKSWKRGQLELTVDLKPN